MRSGEPLAFDRTAANAYLVQQAAASQQPIDRSNLISTENSNELMRLDGNHPTSFDREAATTQLIQHPVVIQLKIGNGPGQGAAWGCDLSYDYVKINAEYTT
jgi:glutamate N-acetyltransferase / amino-acid N-acetyltransferase